MSPSARPLPAYRPAPVVRRKTVKPKSAIDQEVRNREILLYVSMIGKRVKKISSNGLSNSPFKSTFKFNTVKGMVNHEQTGRLGFIFEEDDSVVECWRCVLAEETDA